MRHWEVSLVVERFPHMQEALGCCSSTTDITKQNALEFYLPLVRMAIRGKDATRAGEMAPDG